MKLIDYIKDRIQISKEEENYLLHVFQTKKYQKGDIIRKPNLKTEYIYFLESGYARIFYPKSTKDITFFFLTENSFSLPIETIYFNEPTNFGIEVEVDATFQVFLFSDLKLLFEKIPSIRDIYERELARFIKKTGEKYFLLQFQTAQERYNTMLQKYPDILLHASLGHIASYLGITQETLSRIRTK